MVAVTADVVSVRLQADTSQYRRQIDRARQDFASASADIQKRARRLESAAPAAFERVAQSTRRLGTELTEKAEDFNRFIGANKRKGLDLRRTAKEIQIITRELKGGASVLRVFGRRLSNVVGGLGPLGRATATIADIGMATVDTVSILSANDTAKPELEGLSAQISDLKREYNEYGLLKETD